MTTATWLKDLIEDRFDQSTDPISGEGDIRDALSSEPDVIRAGECSSPRSRMNDIRTPTIFISKENENQEGRSVGYRDKKTEHRLTVEILTNEGREELKGKVSEEYGGYSGEVERIIDSVRVGPAPQNDPNVDLAEYDYVQFDQLSDEIERYGADVFGGEWTVTFVNEAKSILQPT